MIIRKTQQPSDYPSNSISNAKTTGTTNTYSCDYLNDTIDNSKLKSAILVGLSGNVDINISGAWSGVRIPFDTVLRKVGNGFSLSSDNRIIASNNVKRFKATVGIRLSEAYTKEVFPRLNSQTGASPYMESGSTSVSTCLKNETIDNCDTNKNIYASISSEGTGTVKLRGTAGYTYMLVEEL